MTGEQDPTISRLAAGWNALTHSAAANYLLPGALAVAGAGVGSAYAAEHASAAPMTPERVVSQVHESYQNVDTFSSPNHTTYRGLGLLKVYRTGCYRNGRSDGIAVRVEIMNHKGKLLGSSALTDNKPLNTPHFRPATNNWIKTLKYTRDSAVSKPLARGRLNAILAFSNPNNGVTIGQVHGNKFMVPKASDQTCLSEHK